MTLYSFNNILANGNKKSKLSQSFVDDLKRIDSDAETFLREPKIALFAAAADPNPFQF